ncbi:MAG: hypothetical protein GY816_23415 [Cytophagales bacterium]|nr:hypothetical protein [Cytophagales bacterium]
MQTSETLYDYSMKAFSNLAIDNQVSEMMDRIPATMRNFGEEELQGSIEAVGWALKRSSLRTPFSKEVKEYLAQKYIEGRDKHKKYDPREIAKEMRTLKDENNEAVFKTSECKSWQQIASFWSANAKKINEAAPPKPAVSPTVAVVNAAALAAESDVDADEYIEDINIVPTEDDILHDALADANLI